MTSKEALEELLYYATLDDSGFEPTMKHYAQYIENDLEILEILRKHLTTIQITGFGTEKYKDIVVIPYEDEKDAERVRKWLENDE